MQCTVTKGKCFSYWSCYVRHPHAQRYCTPLEASYDIGIQWYFFYAALTKGHDMLYTTPLCPKSTGTGTMNPIADSRLPVYTLSSTRSLNSVL